MIADNNNYNKN